ncbi:type I DNA topoisomerase [Terriglobus saanensis]|uniref:DNA topoisomerase 1 n=1 Tax=Terriglobus saanensis (strain ATCC BAA-1853 / DSM 23119 / SP1PR4) TaxID=401053 RepID=E8V6T0_TERSS|nr:type I DNA topoisomerase [Terriglobus saanensis]ADV83882.1 DNA topoisomerase I [Terriglobus saanensis SP1PR4]
MAKNLVIVESPAKAKTINKYLGSDYIVEASLGHIMDLPKNGIGVELKKRTFEPQLIISPGKEKLVEKLKKLAAKADAVFLAPDPDREGEAIAAHLEMQLTGSLKGKSTIQRVTFNEITKKAVIEAFTHARKVDANLVDAQQTRRVLDRLVGYEISPLLWDKVRRGLSAGRVQTVALRLIVDRENEIKAFNPVEYWPVDANLRPSGNKQNFTARLYAVDGQRISVETVGAPAFADESTTKNAVAQLEKAKWTVASVEAKERRRNAPAPYSTSRLQQDAANRLGFNVRRTMGVAQRLYEGIELGPEGTVGLITYMRTDSTRVSPEAISEARTYIKSLGEKYLPEKPNSFKGKKDAQDAHEAIRPTHVAMTPEKIKKFLSDEQYRLYRLIWQRFVASQMTAAVYDQTAVEIEAKADRTYNLRVTGSVLKFDGFLKVAEPAKSDAMVQKTADAMKTENPGEGEEDEDKSLPALKAGQALDLVDIVTEQKFTEPPPRFNEASLVKELEERGIGRPSTYASIINTIQERDYVKKISKKFIPTEIGMVVTSLLVKNFPYIFDMAYTAKLEDELDLVESGEEKWTSLLDGFYTHLTDEIKIASEEMEEIKRWEKPTDEKCEKCGSPLILRWGKFGSFYACSNYSKIKPMTIAVSGYKKDAKAVATKITAKFKFPFAIKGMVDDAEAFSEEVHDAKELTAALKLAAERGKKIVADPVSCDFTKENYADKPDLAAGDAQGTEEEEEYCDNCGKQMVLKNGPWGPFMACQDYNADPPCKTVRRLNQKVQQKPPEPTGEPCPLCGMELVKRTGAYGEFVSCSGYPKCKYVKQVLLDVPCPKDGGAIAERKARTGNYFYGCTNYPKCDFTSNQKLVSGPCPKCNSSYLLEVAKEGTIHLVCPNNTEALPKRRKKKGAEEVTTPVVECTFEKDTGVAVETAPAKEATPLARPDPEKTRPLVEAVA